MSQDIERRFVSLTSATSARNGAGFYPCQGLYYTPRGVRPRVAFIATHYNVDFSEHYPAEYMARRGYGYLGWNTRFQGNSIAKIEGFHSRTSDESYGRSLPPALRRPSALQSLPASARDRHRSCRRAAWPASSRSCS